MNDNEKIFQSLENREFIAISLDLENQIYQFHRKGMNKEQIVYAIECLKSIIFNDGILDEQETLN